MKLREVIHEMKKWVSFFVIVLCLALNGCGHKNTEADHDTGMQEAYDRSLIAREYADKEFQHILEKYHSDAEISETLYGFYTSESPVYVVGYKYRNGIGDDLTYAYKISVDDAYTCNIIEEGETTAAFLFEN